MKLIKQSAIDNLMLKVYLSLDHSTPATGKTLTVTVSKNGGAFGAMAGSVTEVSSGWYKVALATGDTGTLGDLVVRATATACDDAERLVQVVAFDPTDAAAIGLTNLNAAVGSVPTATQNADALLKRDMSAVTGESARSPLNAFRAVRNKVSRGGSTITVTKEDDTTTAWTAAITTDSTAAPITAVDPA